MSDGAEVHLLTVQREEGPVRILYSRAVLAAVPWIEDSLQRMASLPDVPWPKDLTVISDGEPYPSNETVVVVLPKWYLERLSEVCRLRRGIAVQIADWGPREIMAYDTAWVLAHRFCADAFPGSRSFAKAEELAAYMFLRGCLAGWRTLSLGNVPKHIRMLIATGLAGAQILFCWTFWPFGSRVYDSAWSWMEVVCTIATGRTPSNEFEGGTRGTSVP